MCLNNIGQQSTIDCILQDTSTEEVQMMWLTEGQLVSKYKHLQSDISHMNQLNRRRWSFLQGGVEGR